MSFINILSGLVTDTVKSTVRFDFIIDNLESRFDEGCPPLSEINSIITQKQSLERSILSVQRNINTLNNTRGNIQNIIGTLETALNIIRNLPLPVSVPPGAGVPVSYLMRIAEKLKDTKDLVTSHKSLIQTTGQAANILSGSLINIKQKILSLDNKILNCLSSALENMTEEERNEYLANNFSFSQEAISNENLNPNSSQETSIIHEGFKIEIEYNPENYLLVPQRRAVAISTDGRNLRLLGDYSFTSKTETLIAEMKYTINKRK